MTIGDRESFQKTVSHRFSYTPINRTGDCARWMKLYRKETRLLTAQWKLENNLNKSCFWRRPKINSFFVFNLRKYLFSWEPCKNNDLFMSFQKKIIHLFASEKYIKVFFSWALVLSIRKIARVSIQTRRGVNGPATNTYNQLGMGGQLREFTKARKLVREKKCQYILFCVIFADMTAHHVTRLLLETEKLDQNHVKDYLRKI